MSTASGEPMQNATPQITKVSTLSERESILC